MAVQLVNPFFELFSNCFGSSREIKTSVISLPDEVLEQILDLVCNPTRTALVTKNFNKQSQHSYQILLGQYASYPRLAKLIPTEMQPAHQVQAVYQLCLREARSCGINFKVIEPKLLPLAPERLEQIRRLTIQRLQDKFHVYQAILYRINRKFAQTFEQMTMQGVIEFSETSLKSRDELYSFRPTELDLGNCHLTHLPPLIGQLKALNNLKLNYNDLTALPNAMKSLTKLATLHLNGNPLLSKNVKEVCQSLPRLKTVVIDNEQPDLIELFQTHFPDLQLHVVQILRMEEEV